MKTIEVVISPAGETRIETKGFAGSQCRNATRLLETALGKSTAEQTTPEFHVQTNKHQQCTRRSG